MLDAVATKDIVVAHLGPTYARSASPAMTQDRGPMRPATSTPELELSSGLSRRAWSPTRSESLAMRSVFVTRDLLLHDKA